MRATSCASMKNNPTQHIVSFDVILQKNNHGVTVCLMGNFYQECFDFKTLRLRL
jgi:hypothetical protein